MTSQRHTLGRPLRRAMAAAVTCALLASAAFFGVAWIASERAVYVWRYARVDHAGRVREDIVRLRPGAIYWQVHWPGPEHPDPRTRARWAKRQPEMRYRRDPVIPVDRPWPVGGHFGFWQKPFATEFDRGVERMVPLYAMLLALLATGLAPPLTALAKRWRARRRVARGHCADCGYDVRGGSGNCPECGANRPAEDPRPPTPQIAPHA